MKFAREMSDLYSGVLNMFLLIGVVNNKVCYNCRLVHDVVNHTVISQCLLVFHRLVRRSPIPLTKTETFLSNQRNDNDVAAIK